MITELFIDEFSEFCKYGNVALAEKFIQENKIDLNYDDGYFGFIAACHNQLEILKLLSKNGADLHSEDESALWGAAIYGQLECVKFLVEEQNADINKIKGTYAYKQYFKEIETKRRQIS